MKNFLFAIILIFAIVIQTVFIVKATSLDTTVLQGDVNGDGRVTAADARILLRYVAGLPTGYEKEQLLKTGDMDCDGEITAADARIVLRICAKLFKHSDYLKNIAFKSDVKPGGAKSAKTVLKYESIYYFVTSSGLESFDETTKKRRVLFESENIGGLYQDGDELYFSVVYDNDYEEGVSTIYRLKNDDIKKVWSYDKEKPEYNSYFSDFNDFVVKDDYIITCKSANHFWAYSMSKDIMLFQSETVGGYIKLLDDDIISNGHRRFTLYSYALKTNNFSVLRGQNKDKTENPTDLYDNFEVIGKDLYYTKRTPYSVCKYKENNKDQQIIKFDNEYNIELYTSDGYLYILCTDNVQKGTGKSEIYMYNPQTNSLSDGIEIDSLTYTKFMVFENVLIYTDNNNIIYIDLDFK